eukprot:638545-Hanusia_phi.AAC.2
MIRRIPGGAGGTVLQSRTSSTHARARLAAPDPVAAGWPRAGRRGDSDPIPGPGPLSPARPGAQHCQLSHRGGGGGRGDASGVCRDIHGVASLFLSLLLLHLAPLQDRQLCPFCKARALSDEGQGKAPSVPEAAPLIAGQDAKKAPKRTGLEAQVSVLMQEEEEDARKEKRMARRKERVALQMGNIGGPNTQDSSRGGLGGGEQEEEGQGRKEEDESEVGQKLPATRESR